ncbi:hypothetical protein RI367_004940 [Sorochytrium milnesiophthora]
MASPSCAPVVPRIHQLPSDVLLVILEHCDSDTIINLQKAAPTIHSVAKSNLLWHKVYKRRRPLTSRYMDFAAASDWQTKMQVEDWYAQCWTKPVIKSVWYKDLLHEPGGAFDWRAKQQIYSNPTGRTYYSVGDFLVDEWNHGDGRISTALFIGAWNHTVPSQFHILEYAYPAMTLTRQSTVTARNAFLLELAAASRERNMMTLIETHRGEDAITGEPPPKDMTIVSQALGGGGYGEGTFVLFGELHGDFSRPNLLLRDEEFQSKFWVNLSPCLEGQHALFGGYNNTDPNCVIARQKKHILLIEAERYMEIGTVGHLKVCLYALPDTFLATTFNRAPGYTPVATITLGLQDDCITVVSWTSLYLPHTIITGHQSGRVCLWDISAKMLMSIISVTDQPIRSVASVEWEDKFRASVCSDKIVQCAAEYQVTNQARNGVQDHIAMCHLLPLASPVPAVRYTAELVNASKVRYSLVVITPPPAFNEFDINPHIIARPRVDATVIFGVYQNLLFNLNAQLQLEVCDINSGSVLSRVSLYDAVYHDTEYAMPSTADLTAWCEHVRVQFMLYLGAGDDLVFGLNDVLVRISTKRFVRVADAIAKAAECRAVKQRRKDEP